MTNANDNGHSDAMQRYIDSTKLEVGFCTHPYGYEACPHNPGPAFASGSRWNQLNDFGEGDRRGGLGLYLGHRLNQIPSDITITCTLSQHVNISIGISARGYNSMR